MCREDSSTPMLVDPSQETPHVHGEDRTNASACSKAGETPPRAWGRQAILTNTSSPERNTPTCVGKTRMQRQRARQYRKHPHVRGEDRRSRMRKGSGLETPPRAWGRHSADAINHFQRGNTPTCVGKTARRPCTRPRTWKHPHVRGEDSLLRFRLTLRTETPPRAWGRPMSLVVTDASGRNTPTCVGKTDLPVSQRRIVEETPPRAWGRLKLRVRDRIVVGNTPTCVGKTDPLRCTQSDIEKHPHVRGEDADLLQVFACHPETPPRAWGRLNNAIVYKVTQRNTPTCVGKTLCRFRPRASCKKHPHVRGEDL